jgi:hypothetical protein
MAINPVTKLPFQPADFNIGKEPKIVGRVFHVVRCDPTTRKYFAEELGVEMPSNGSYPDDKHSAVLRAQQTEADPRRSRINPLTEIRQEDKLRSYLQFAGKVLRFQCEWDDTKAFKGEVHSYVLHFYLADDTVELKELRNDNDGHAPFPLLLNRQKVPITSRITLEHQNGQNMNTSYQREQFVDSRVISSGENESQQHLKASDLICGETLQILGRRILLQSCDRFTHEFYDRHLGMQQVLEQSLYVGQPPAGSRQTIREMQRTGSKGGFQTRDRPPSQPPVAYNPHVHFGSENDNIGLDIHRFLKYDHLQVLRLTACLASEKSKRHPIERERRYVVNFYLSDQTLAIFETVERNSGMSGGKFLARARYKIGTSARARWVEPADMLVGRNLSLVHPKTLARLPTLEILGADDYTQSYVAVAQGTRSEQYTEERVDNGAVRFLDDEAGDSGSGQAAREGNRALESFRKTFQHKKRKLEKAFRHLDNDWSGRVNKVGFDNALSACDTAFSAKDQAALISLLFAPGGRASVDHCSKQRRQMGQCTWINYAKFLERVFGEGYN